MNKGLFEKYWSFHHKDILLILALLILIGVVACDIFFDTYFWVFFSAYGLRDYFRHDAKLQEIERLKAKGLTVEDAENIRFVKQWEQTRTEGKLSYCLFDGGIIQGGILALFLCLIAIAIFGVQKLFAELSYMFIVTGGACIVGGLMASLFYRYLWKVNEQRFKQLTQFEHIIS